MKTKALLDSGANTIYIDKAYAQRMKLPLTPLSNPVPVYNIDGTRNAAGSITHCAKIIIQFQEHCEKVTAEVTNLGKNQMILDYTWLSCHNPEIDWTTGTVKMTRCPWTCHNLERETSFCSTNRIQRTRFSSTHSCLEQEESAPTTDSKPVNLCSTTNISPVPKSVLKERI